MVCLAAAPFDNQGVQYGVKVECPEVLPDRIALTRLIKLVVAARIRPWPSTFSALGVRSSAADIGNRTCAGKDRVGALARLCLSRRTNTWFRSRGSPLCPPSFMGFGIWIKPTLTSKAYHVVTVVIIKL